MFEPVSAAVTRWTLSFRDMPPRITPGQLRGALLRRYRHTVCPEARWDDPCEQCPLLPDCSYGQVFAAKPVDLEVLTSFRTIPRPYIFRLDPVRRDTFWLTLVGAATVLFPRIVTIFRSLERRGISRESSPFTLSAIDQVTPDGPLPLRRGELPQARPLDEWIPRSDPPAQVQIHFLTPTTLREAGRTLRAPEPGPLLRRLRDRMAALGAAWCGGAPSWDYRRMGALADGVTLQRDTTRWIEVRRRSGTSGAVYPASGFAGRTTCGDLEPSIWRLLCGGQILGVGKSCTFGNGWYRIETGDGAGNPLDPLSVVAAEERRGDDLQPLNGSIEVRRRT